ncbi:MAG: ABC transporter substrate-binding protein [Hungatella hathewayi]|uniref:Extracellular solute-binding protein n=1 Tax=Hungatella hathewayi WAL-18680 TaxID=742737 RepID=G5I9H9_9FIRM|nr:extracellular solute-binding protein [Hungatella hathewayi]EHI61718.1 hypothetical protein HMPREF9473_00169 [ [Hungatella hathewayi WAL-18680]MBS4982850.1 extracellular solute-binding protein [Hungatella hathewayi]
MKRKALISVVLSMSLVLGMTGCSSGNTKETEAAGTTTSSETAATSTAETTSEKVSEPVTVSFYSPLPTIQEQYDSAASRYKDATGNDVEMTLIYNESYKDKLKVSMASNSAPDIFAHWSGGPMNSYIQEDLIIDLTPYMEESGLKDRIMESSLQMGTYDGKIYAVAAGGDLMVFPLFYNKEIFAQYNLEVPETLDELETVCDTLKENGIIPFALANLNKWTGSAYYMYLVDRYGGPDAFYNAANRVNGGSFEDEAFVKAGETIQKWVNNGYFPDGVNGLDNSTGQDRQLLYTGKAAMFIYPTSVIAIIKDEMPDFADKIGIATFPVDGDDKEAAKRVVGSAGSNFLSISSNCENPDAAFAFIEELASEDTVTEMLEVGRCVPVNGIVDKVTDPLRQNALNMLQDATYVQLAYDQYLSPVLGEKHKDTTQELFGLTMTPEEAAKAMEATAKEQEK